MKKRYAALAIFFGALLAVRVHAQFAVFDAAVNANMLIQLGKMGVELRNWQSLLTQMEANSQWLPSSVRTRFLGYTQPFSQPQINDIFGETTGWEGIFGGSIQSALQIGAAWGRTTVPLQPTPPFVGLPTSSPLLLQLASTEIQDAVARNAILTSANARQPINPLVIQNLQQACLGDSFLDSNRQLNCGAAAGILNTQQSQVANGILAAQLDLETARAMDDRNCKAAEVNEAGLELLDNLTRTEAVFSSQAVQNTVLF